MRATCVLLACLAAAAVAAPPTPPPNAVKVSVGELARVEITPDAAGGVGWASGAADADLFVDELASKGGKVRLLLQAKRAGTFRIVLWTKGETDSAFVEVVATGVGPDPVPPGPNPPGPTPEPNDPLYAPVKAAWEKGKDAAALAKLVKVYKAAAATDLTLFATAGQLRTALKDKVTENKLADGDLRPVREAIQAELEQFLPKQVDAALTQDHRANAKSTFTRIVTCLEALK